MFKEKLENVRNTIPLIHNITNYVTVNDCANILLACGGSPIMSDDMDEVEEITTICGGLNICLLYTSTPAKFPSASQPVSCTDKSDQSDGIFPHPGKTMLYRALCPVNKQGFPITSARLSSADSCASENQRFTLL